MKTKIIFSPKCLSYGEGHIESPERILKARDFLAKKGYEFLEPKPASLKALLQVHKESYLKKLKEGKIEDSDTPNYPQIFEIARLSVGGAILASKVFGFSLMRPPGHHAGKEGRALGAMTQGFCYLNNLAIAVKLSKKNTLILDIDGHHGNGTEEIFKGDKKIVYISLHRYPFYPGTGFKSETNCFNFPLKAECGEEKYLRTLENALKRVELSAIDQVAVSAGFDTLEGDLASLGLSPKTFFKIGKIIKRLKKPTFFVLEGGYLPEVLGESIDNLLQGFEEQ